MSNQTVLITGSSTGFGKLYAQSLLKEGYTVFATMRNLKTKNSDRAAELNRFAENSSGKLHLLELDVTDENSVNSAVEKAINLEGKINIVINNAGGGYGLGSFTEAATEEQFNHIFNVNVSGVQRVFRAVLPHMRKNKSGLILTISSVMGRIVLPFAGPYTATKYAVEGLVETYRYELSSTGVDISIIEPGGFPTDFMANSTPPIDSARIETYGELANLPNKVWGGVDEFFSGENAPDPQVVIDESIKIINLPQGQRPLRVVVDPMTGGEGPSHINKITDQIQAGIIGSYGL